MNSSRDIGERETYRYSLKNVVGWHYMKSIEIFVRHIGGGADTYEARCFFKGNNKSYLATCTAGAKRACEAVIRKIDLHPQWDETQLRKYTLTPKK